MVTGPAGCHPNPSHTPSIAAGSRQGAPNPGLPGSHQAYQRARSLSIKPLLRLLGSKRGSVFRSGSALAWQLPAHERHLDASLTRGGRRDAHPPGALHSFTETLREKPSMTEIHLLRTSEDAE